MRAVIEPGDILCLEGDNQKQADFLATELAAITDVQLLMGMMALREICEKYGVQSLNHCLKLQ